MSETVATWVYAVTTYPTDVNTVARGVADEPIRTVRFGDIAAVVGSVGADHGDEKRLRHNLSDMMWLERAIRRHHQVVAAVAQDAPTVPLRFGTVYHDDGRVQDLLAHQYSDLVAALGEVAGHAEWGVQVFSATPEAHDPDAPAPAGSNGPATSPGTAYLMRRRAERDTKDRHRRAVAHAVEQLEAELAPWATAVLRQPPTEHPDQPGQMVLNVACLVAEARQGEFTRVACAWDGRVPGMRVRVTGPWPAYSFVRVTDRNQQDAPPTAARDQAGALP